MPHSHRRTARDLTQLNPESPLRFPALLLLPLIVLLSGCVRYDETLVLNADRSGSATLILERPDDPRADAAAAMFHEDQMRQNLPAGIQLDWKKSAANGNAVITALYTFDDYRVLIAWAANKTSPLNNISVLENNGTLEFSRRIAPVADTTAAEMKDFGADISVCFKLQGPGKLLDTNAPRADGRTATWEFNATDLFAPSGRTLTARFAGPHGSYTTLVTALAVLAAITMIALWIFNRRSRST